MINPQTITDNQLQRLAAAVSSPKLLDTATKRAVSRTSSEIRKFLAETKPQSALPFRWSHNPAKQARARRWYFANKVPKGSKGGRYQRTGRMVKAFNVVGKIISGGAVISIENRAKGSEFVHGARQVPSHARTGWNTVEETRRKFAPILSKRLAENIVTVLDERAGVR